MSDSPKVGRIGYMLPDAKTLTFRDFDTLKVDLAGDSIEAWLNGARRFLRLSSVRELVLSMPGQQAVFLIKP